MHEVASWLLPPTWPLKGVAVALLEMMKEGDHMKRLAHHPLPLLLVLLLVLVLEHEVPVLAPAVAAFAKISSALGNCSFPSWLLRHRVSFDRAVGDSIDARRPWRAFESCRADRACPHFRSRPRNRKVAVRGLGNRECVGFRLGKRYCKLIRDEWVCCWVVACV